MTLRLRSGGWCAIARRPKANRDAASTVRNDTGVYEGGEISIYYDPMIAKLVTHAKTRAAAIDAQADALDAFTIEGIGTTFRFLPRSCTIRAGAPASSPPHSSPRNFRAVLSGTSPTGAVARTIAGVAAAIDHVMGERKRRISGQLDRAVTRERRRAIWLGGEELHAEVAHDDEAIAVLFEDGNRHVLSSSWAPGLPVWEGTVDGAAACRPAVRMVPNGFELALSRLRGGRLFVYTEREGELCAA